MTRNRMREILAVIAKYGDKRKFTSNERRFIDSLIERDPPRYSKKMRQRILMIFEDTVPQQQKDEVFGA